MVSTVKKIAVTGGSGQIAYNLLFRIANGDLLGPKQKIELNIIDLPELETVLKAVKMELEDCAFPLLEQVRIGSNEEELFGDVDYALLVGAKPRGPGMERADLLADNGKIFVKQGKALNHSAKTTTKVLVVGNPCNTNCLIAMHHAPKLARKNFMAMMFLDHNRAKNLLAREAKIHVTAVKGLTVWGNHSATQVPDYTYVNCIDKIEKSWLQGEFFELVQKRGAAIIAARGKSSAASAAHAIIETIGSLNHKTAEDDWFSCAVCSDGNPYGIEEGLIFGFPCYSLGNEDLHILPELTWDFFIREKIAITQKELIEERNAIQHLLKP